MDDKEDIFLLVALSKGEKSAFDNIFRKYYPLLCTYGSRLVGLENAKEIVEDTLLWLWEHREVHVIETSLANYLMKSVYRRALNQLKKEQIKKMADTRFFEEMQDMMQDVDFFQFKELEKRIKETVDLLPPTYREVFVMHRFRNKTYKEIAERLNVSTKTVDYRMQQALKLLRQELKDYLPLLLFLL